MDHSLIFAVEQPSSTDSAAVGNTSAIGLSRHENDHQKLAERLEDLAIELRSMIDREAQTIPSATTLMSLAQKVYGARRSVDDVFGMAGFSVSPAWDMMLDLYQARIRGARISVTSACIGGACAPTTGLRWLQALEASQLVFREPDPEDKRRQVVALTDAAMVKIEKALMAYL